MGKLDAKTGGIKTADAVQRSPTQTAQERRWRAEEALHTVKRYHEISSDSKLMGEVRQLAKEQMGHLAKVAGNARTDRSSEPRGSSGGGTKNQRRR